MRIPDIGMKATPWRPGGGTMDEDHDDDGDDNDWTSTWPDDPADHIDHQVIRASRWFDEEIALGCLVVLLVLAALGAFWVAHRRRKKQLAEAQHVSVPSTFVLGMSPPTAPTLYDLQAVTTEPSAAPRSRNPSTTKPPKLVVSIFNVNGREEDVKPASNGHGHGHGGHAPVTVKTVVDPGTPEASTPDPDVEAGLAGPWEPLYLLGLPGQVTRARRRSVSLRSADGDEDSDGEQADGRDGDRDAVSELSARLSGSESNVSGVGELDEESREEPSSRHRKRSVTFNTMVEEVQILGQLSRSRPAGPVGPPRPRRY